MAVAVMLAFPVLMSVLIVTANRNRVKVKKHLKNGRLIRAVRALPYPVLACP